MRLCVCCFVFTWTWIIVHASIYADVRSNRERKKPQIVEGMEFDKISRSTLLKMLATFEESVNTRLAPYKLRPQFVAQFANNKYTRPFIYPHVFKKSKINV
ncbi:uncharacterized protein [Choristoneura fumiferana]|uniref:uncharacterized protein n=1 Tax=Choristoneura fumiferana TaxID=7141 RepID=UPI003D15AB88